MSTRGQRGAGTDGAGLASPWTVDLRSLSRQPGSARDLSVTLPAPERIGPDLIGVEEGSAVDLELRLESVSEGVLVSGTVGARLRGECARCLAAITGTLVVRLQELYAYPGSSTDETTDADEIRRISDDRLDLLPAVRDAVVLDLPLNPLCRPDCRGLCPDCGERWEDLPPEHSHEAVDPRWAALRGLLDESASDGHRARPDGGDDSN